MNTLGPYYIFPYSTPGGALADFPPQLDIPIIVGRYGFVEIINTSNFSLIIDFQSMGQVFQELRSKVIYKMVQDVQGTQMLHLSTMRNATTVNVPTRYIRNPVAYQNGENGFFEIWVNIYEEGEVEWYPPVSLSPPPSQSLFYATATGTTGITLVLPNTSTFYNVPAAFGTCNLVGFELSIDSIGTSAAGNMVISNVNNQPDGSNTLNYRLKTLQNTLDIGATYLIVTYPTPIPNFLGQQITLTVPNLGGAAMDLNVHYSLS